MSSFTSRVMVGVLASLAVAACFASAARATIIADWQFTEGDFLADSSGNGHTLVKVGTVGDTGGVATFNSTGFLRTDTALDLSGVQKVRMSWSMLATADSVGVVWNHGWNASTGYGLLTSVNENGAGNGTVGVFNHSNSSYTSDNYAHAYGANATWQNWSSEIDTAATGISGVVKVFLDGMEVGSDRNTSAGLPAFGNFNFEIGDLIAPGVAAFVGQIDRLTIESIPVPEPGTLTLLSCSLAGLLAYAWRKRR